MTTISSFCVLLIVVSSTELVCLWTCKNLGEMYKRLYMCMSEFLFWVYILRIAEWPKCKKMKIHVLSRRQHETVDSIAHLRFLLFEKSSFMMSRRRIPMQMERKTRPCKECGFSVGNKWTVKCHCAFLAAFCRLSNEGGRKKVSIPRILSSWVKTHAEFFSEQELSWGLNLLWKRRKCEERRFQAKRKICPWAERLPCDSNGKGRAWISTSVLQFSYWYFIKVW